MSAGTLCDAISSSYGVVFESQTVRLKLKEYEELGVLSSHKEGKSLLYHLLPSPKALFPSQDTLPPSSAFPAAKPKDSPWSQLLTAVTFFQEAAPFGFIGSTILDQENQVNEYFQFKHHFIVHTLEDGVLADVLTAIRQQRKISFENRSTRSGNLSLQQGVPLKIFVSTQTGRRYVCLYLEERRRFTNFRLDSMAEVKLLEVFNGYEHKQELLSRNLSRCWGVSFGGTSRIEEIYIKLYIDEEKEPHILQRLYREGRGGEILPVRENEYLYSGLFFDTNEMLSWIKTFTGRIMDIQGSNTFAIHKLTRDFEKMYEMYCL